MICLDEKPVTLHADVRPSSPARPGREARRDNEYERCGTANVFCAVEPKAGRHFTFPTPDRSGFEFAQVAVALALAYPAAKTIHLVMDNLNIHRQKLLADVFGTEMAAEVWGRFTVHYTPTHGSWLNQAEIEIGIFSRQCLGKRRIPNLKTLRREAKAWNRRMNRDRVKIAWSLTAKPLAASLATKGNPLRGQRPSRLPGALGSMPPAFSSCPDWFLAQNFGAFYPNNPKRAIAALWIFLEGLITRFISDLNALTFAGRSPYERNP